MSKFKQLINPHSHSHHSLDGAATVDDLLKRSQELGASHLTLTEHGNLASALELYQKSKKYNITPIIGIELYLQPPFMDEVRKMVEAEVEKEGKFKSLEDKQAKIEKALKNEYVHLTVHFKDEWAYQYFCKLTPAMESRAVVKWGERKPIATLEEIAGAAGHITVCSSCLIGAVSRFLLPRRKSGVSRPDLAEKAYNLIREIAGKDNFFVEVFPDEVTHDWKKGEKGQPGRFVKHECTAYAPEGDLVKPANQFVIDLAKKNNDPILISLDSHFAWPEQHKVQTARLSNGKDDWKFYNSYHVRSSEESFKILNRQLNIDEKTMEKWIDNSYLWASNFNSFKMTTSKDRFVLQPLPDNWQDLLMEKINAYGRMNWNDTQMISRLKYEIDALAYNGMMNLISYLLTVGKIADFCKDNDVLLNVRGSAGGSLLLYLLGISGVNPISYELSFDRFITPGRIKSGSLPDCDLDVSSQEAVFDMLQNEFGDAFCNISISTQLKLKSSIKDAEREKFGKVRPETEKLCKTLPLSPQGVEESDHVFGYTDDFGHHIDGVFETNQKLRDYAELNPELWDQVTEMLGINRQMSRHPCGLIIADRPVQDYVPITYMSGVRVTGYGPKMVEAAGLIKYDVLGLNTLRDMQEALKLIKARTGLKIDPWNLPDDKRCWEAFGRGDTATVFQFDTPTVIPYLIATKPKQIEDLIALTSLCRPGTLDAPESESSTRTLSQLYVARIQGEQVSYVHNDLEPILNKTQGIALYQEQSLQIFRDIAGYSAEEAESVRRAIGKKDAKLLAEQTKALKERSLARGWSEEQADLLIKQIMASARYSFNKSHAASYSVVAYACMWLKTNYPLEWWTATLTNASKDDLKHYWTFTSQFMLMPNINKSDKVFKIVKDGDYEFIQAPITLINGVGQAVTKELTEKAPFSSLSDFVERVERRIVNKRIVTRLIFSGTMDELFDKNMNDAEKLDKYFEEISKKTETKKELVPTEYLSLSPLKNYLFKKSIYKVYSADLTPITVPVLIERGLIKKEYNIMTYVDPNRIKLHGAPLIKSSRYHEYLEEEDQDHTFAMICYVVGTEEKTFGKDGEQKTMLRLTLETDDTIIETVKFPDWGQTQHGVDQHIEGAVALVIMRKAFGKTDVIVQKILPIEKIDF